MLGFRKNHYNTWCDFEGDITEIKVRVWHLPGKLCVHLQRFAGRQNLWQIILGPAEIYIGDQFWVNDMIEDCPARFKTWRFRRTARRPLGLIWLGGQHV